MKKNLLFCLFVVALLFGVVQAGLAPSILPESSHYQGRHSFSEVVGDGEKVEGHLEFAVYTGTQAEDMISDTGYQGEADFVYAYQIFNYQESDAALTYFAVTGINPATVEAGSIGAMDDLAGGIQPDDGGYFNASETKGIWEFNNAKLIQGAQSWFLFVYSNYDWVPGGMELQTTYDDDIPTPEVPEPMTLALFLGGTVLSLRRRHKRA